MVEHHRNVSLEAIVEEIDGVVYVEEWRPVERFGRYEISSFGRLKRLAIWVKSRKAFNPERIIPSSAAGKKKYLRVQLIADTLKKTVSIHRLVGLHFIPLIEGKPQINHITGDKLKNHFTQLEWCTCEENIEHAVRTGLAKRGRKIKPYIKKGYKLGLKPIINIDSGEIFPHAVALQEKSGMSIKTIRRILTGIRYNHTPYRYVGQENVCKLPIHKPIKEKRIGQFDNTGRLIHLLSSLQDIPIRERSSVSAFMNGRSTNVGGMIYKKMGVDGKFIEPPKFISNRKPKPTPQPVTPSKKVIQMDLQGNFIAEHPSIFQAAKAISLDPANFKKALKRPRKYCKGFIWKVESPGIPV